MKTLLILLIALVTCSCEKSDDLVAPPITQENSFSCKIDGELFVAQPNGGFLQFPGILVIGSNWIILLRNQNNDELYLNLKNNELDNFLPILKADGDQYFGNDEQNSVELIWKNKIYISNTNTGIIKINEWVNDSILILEFSELLLYEKNNPIETISLAEGKLNINLTTMEQD